jgi:hypothetical protein
VLFRRASLILEGDDALGRSRQIGEGEADALIPVARMPFDLGDHAAGLCLAIGLVAEVCVIPAHIVRWPADRSLGQMSAAFPERLVGRQADRIPEGFGFEELLHPG